MFDCLCAGLFLCKGNERTVRMFDIAWRDYMVSDPCLLR